MLEYGPYAFLFWDDVERMSPGNDYFRADLDRELEARQIRYTLAQMEIKRREKENARTRS